MNESAGSDAREGREIEWEIYEIGAAKPFAWSWRCRMSGRVMRQGDVMYSNILEAVKDAAAHGMNEPQRCDIVRMDSTRIPLEDGLRMLQS